MLAFGRHPLVEAQLVLHLAASGLTSGCQLVLRWASCEEGCSRFASRVLAYADAVDAVLTCCCVAA